MTGVGRDRNGVRVHGPTRGRPAISDYARRKQPALDGDGVMGQTGSELLHGHSCQLSARTRVKSKWRAYLSSCNDPMDNKRAECRWELGETGSFQTRLSKGEVDVGQVGYALGGEKLGGADHESMEA